MPLSAFAVMVTVPSSYLGEMYSSEKAKSYLEANKIVVINHGEVVEMGTHEELVNIEGGAYRSLHDMQFKGKKDKEIF